MEMHALGSSNLDKVFDTGPGLTRGDPRKRAVASTARLEINQEDH